VEQRTFSVGELWGVVRDNRAFRRLYAANAVSQIGDWLNVVALFSLLLELTGKGEAVAFVLVTRLLPAFFVGPAAGVLADRASRRAMMVICDLLRAALVLCLLFVRKPEHVPIAYAVMAAHSLASAFFEPAQAATFPNLVPEKDLLLAGALENALWSVTLAAGASLGGLIVAAAGRDAAFIVDAASFVGSALLLRGLPDAAARAKSAVKEKLEEIEEQRAQDTQGWANLLGLNDVREGLRYVAGHREVRGLLIVKSAFGLTLGGVLVLLAHFGEREFSHGGGAGIAALWTARGIGSFVGPFLAFRLGGGSPAALRRGIIAAQLTIVCSYLLFSGAPSLWLAAAALAVANAGGSILWTYGSTLLATIVPDQVRGRVAAAEMGGMTLAMSASTLATGELLDAGVPARALMAGCALVGVAPALFWLTLRAQAPSAVR
jgi:MFS family permease